MHAGHDQRLGAVDFADSAADGVRATAEIADGVFAAADRAGKRDVAMQGVAAVGAELAEIIVRIVVAAVENERRVDVGVLAIAAVNL